jgi:hypothetical protein
VATAASARPTASATATASRERSFGSPAGQPSSNGFPPSSTSFARKPRCSASHASCCFCVGPPRPVFGSRPRSRNAFHGDERRRDVGPGELRRNLPALVGHERGDLPLAIDHETNGHALHPSGREPGGDLPPQQRRHLVAHDPVEDPPGLLGVHLVEVDRVRLLERPLDLGLRDRVEHHPPGLFRGHSEQLGEVPGDRLALAVEVGREPDRGCRAAGLLQLVDSLALALEHLVARLEAVLEVDPGHRLLLALGPAGGQVADVADAGEDHEVGPEVLPDRLRLGGALDDDQLLAARGGRTGARGAGLPLAVGRGGLRSGLGNGRLFGHGERGETRRNGA